MPLVGMVALGIILYAVVARIRLPRRFPGFLPPSSLVARCITRSDRWDWPVEHSSTSFTGIAPWFSYSDPRFLKGFAGAMKYLPTGDPF